MEKLIWSWWTWLWKSHKTNLNESDNKKFSTEIEGSSIKTTILINHLNETIKYPSKNYNSTIEFNNHENSNYSSNSINETSVDIELNNITNNNLNYTLYFFNSNFNNYTNEFNNYLDNFSILTNSNSDDINFNYDNDENLNKFILNVIQNCTYSYKDCCNFNDSGYLFLNYLSGYNITNCTTNFQNNFNGNQFDDTIEFIKVLGTAIVLGFIILSTVIGNVFVIAAILLEKNLRSVSNYLILSLAVADLLVACLVMPLSAVYEISKEWTLGPELCDMWTSCDVLCCTASILHLVAIALDRYWAVTNIDYIHHRTTKRVGLMILVIWSLSLLVSIAPLLGWKDPKWHERISIQLKCMVSQDISYQVFATASSFYVPLFVILILYWRIFQTARKRIRRRQQTTVTQKNTMISASGGAGAALAATIAVHAVIGRPLPTISETTTNFTNLSSAHTSPDKGSYGNGTEKIENDLPTADCSTGTGGPPSSISYPRSKFQRKKTQTSVDSKRERKAAKTLAIITGAFVCCWAPFFVFAILLPICLHCQISPLIMSLSLWLGYFNSTLNPIIYTIFSPEFRNAFKRILCGRRNSLRRRIVMH